MAIVLVTGLPGHGKTLYTIAKWKEVGEKEGRPIYHNGIPDLALPWQKWDVEKWEELPPGAIFICDEAQQNFPTRGRGEPPPHVAELAKHRHRGVDFVLITQNPMLIDSFVRRLVDRHFHVIRKFGTHSATIHEFPNGAKESVATSREGSIRHEWRYPKEVFKLYKSAELHTVQRRIPARVYLLMAMPLIFGALVFVAWQRLAPDDRGAALAADAAGSAPASAGALPPQSARGAQSTEPPPDWYAAQVPRVQGLPHTAPAYDGLTAPQRVPYPAACVESGERCKCYTDQATPLQVPADLCRQLVAGGLFLAWVPAQAGAASAPALPGGGLPAVSPGLAELRTRGVGMVARPSEL